jgi:two-component system chemotaxis response regulator CheB
MSAESIAQTDRRAENELRVIVPWACPDCSGTIWESRQGPLLHFQCRVGHTYSPESFLQEQTDTIERTLWAAIRLLEERAAFADHLAQEAMQQAHEVDEQRFTADAERHRSKAAELRRVIEA